MDSALTLPAQPGHGVGRGGREGPPARQPPPEHRPLRDLRDRRPASSPSPSATSGSSCGSARRWAWASCRPTSASRPTRRAWRMPTSLLEAFEAVLRREPADHWLDGAARGEGPGRADQRRRRGVRATPRSSGWSPSRRSTACRSSARRCASTASGPPIRHAPPALNLHGDELRAWLRSRLSGVRSAGRGWSARRCRAARAPAATAARSPAPSRRWRSRAPPDVRRGARDDRAAAEHVADARCTWPATTRMTCGLALQQLGEPGAIGLRQPDLVQPRQAHQDRRVVHGDDRRDVRVRAARRATRRRARRRRGRGSTCRTRPAARRRPWRRTAWRMPSRSWFPAAVKTGIGSGASSSFARSCSAGSPEFAMSPVTSTATGAGRRLSTRSTAAASAGCEASSSSRMCGSLSCAIRGSEAHRSAL